MKKRIVIKYWYLYIVVLLSVLYLAYLVSSSEPGVFFSSDGGIKYLMLKQVAEGHGFKYLYLPQPQWVHQIWANGFFPFRRPFVYPSPQGYLFVFPPAFQVINSFFYTHFGIPGLYIVPVLSTLLLWVSVIFLLWRCGISPLRIAIGLFILVFCSPLTLYGATYWEHMPAVLLLFAGLIFVVKPTDNALIALILGLLSGLAAWFRPEALVMNLLYWFAVVYLFIRESNRSAIWFLIGLAIGIASFLVFNRIEFGSYFGVHSRQVLLDSVQGGVKMNHFRNLIANNLINSRNYEFILLTVPIIYVWLRYRRALPTRVLLLIGITVAYCIMTPFIVPNDGGRQWGARYFLPLVTVVLVLLLLVDREWKPHYPVWLLLVLLVFAAYTFQHNTYKGGLRTFVWENHHRITPDLNYLNKKPGKVVVVSLHYIAMELGYLFDDKYFFLAPDDSSLNKLLPQLKRQGISEYTYIYDVRVPSIKPASLTDTLVNWPHENGDFEYRDYVIP